MIKTISSRKVDVERNAQHHARTIEASLRRHWLYGSPTGSSIIARFSLREECTGSAPPLILVEGRDRFFNFALATPLHN